MAADSTISKQPLPGKSQSQARDKVRLRFRKAGDLRLVSHRDLMKCFERAIRRANLPIHATQGFHPMPRMVFAMSLGLGIVGLDEVLEMEFTEPIEPEKVQVRLAAQMPPGLEILRAQRISVRSSAQVLRAGYRAAVPAGQIAGVPSRIADLLAAPECWINRDRPTARRLNVRPYVSELRLIPSSRQDGWHGVAVVEMLLWVTPNGTARPGEILELLGLGSLLESGVVLERFVLEICDETTQNGLLPPDFGKSQATLPKERAGVPGNVPDSPSRPTAIVSGPMSFDS